MVYHKASSCPARCGPATTLPALRLDMATLMIALLGVSGFPRRTAAALRMIGALMCRTRGVRTLKMSHDAVECDAVAFGAERAPKSRLRYAPISPATMRSCAALQCGITRRHASIHDILLQQGVCSCGVPAVLRNIRCARRSTRTAP